jgi:hypothetical protein
MVFAGLASKLVVTVSSGLTSKPVETISTGLTSKPIVTVSSGLTSKPTATVYAGLASKHASICHRPTYFPRTEARQPIFIYASERVWPQPVCSERCSRLLFSPGSLSLCARSAQLQERSPAQPISTVWLSARSAQECAWDFHRRSFFLIHSYHRVVQSCQPSLPTQFLLFKDCRWSSCSSCIPVDSFQPTVSSLSG